MSRPANMAQVKTAETRTSTAPYDELSVDALPSVVAVKIRLSSVPCCESSSPPETLWMRLARERVNATKKANCISLHHRM